MHGRILLSALTIVLLLTQSTLAQDAERPTRGVPMQITTRIVEDAQPESLAQIARQHHIEGFVGPLSVEHVEPQQGGNWVFTFHRGEVEALEAGRITLTRAALYRRDEDGYTLRAEWQSGLGVFLQQPRFFTLHANDTAYSLLWVPGGFSGTGNHRMDTVYQLDDEQGTVTPIAFEPAPMGYMRLHEAGAEGAVMKEGEGIWKGESTTIRAVGMAGLADQMRFTFYIWNDGDGNCCPTAGQVTGSYTVRETDEGPRIEIDTFERGDVER